jgi:ribulose-5-phosphate 4-epimerase/fuculose-1-phosphate aldolase
MSNEARQREDICLIGKSLFDRGFCVGSAGNISVRLDDGFLITPTDACLGRLDPARIAKVDQAGLQVSGDKASKAIVLHREIYETDSGINAVVHTHATHLVALSVLASGPLNNLIPPLTAYHVMKAGRVPLLPYRRPGDPELATLVRPLVSQCHGVMLNRIGPTFWHKTLAEASAALEEAEETAKLVFLTRGSKAAPLDAEQISELQQVFQAKW